MNKQELEQLIERYLAGECTSEEKNYLMEFFDSYRASEEIWDTEGLGDMAKFKHILYREIKSKSMSGEQKLRFVDRSLFKRTIKFAATIVIVLGLGLVVYNLQDQATPADLAGPLLVDWNTKNTASGEKLTFRLSDGTVVKLNSDSKLTFPGTFLDSVRVVELEGEAFFDVTKDPIRPFLIRTKDITTSVLGTSFNINAYPESNHIAVSVVTGKVKVEKVSYKNVDDPVNVLYLYPTRKATYVKEDHKLIESDFVIEQEIGWKQGIIYFKDASESDVVERLERWYGVDIQVKNSSLREWGLTASFDNQMLDAVLLSLSHTAHFNYSINNKKIIIHYIKTE
jgi:transmembrane sensor